MNQIITTIGSRLDYNCITVQTFPMTYQYKIPSFHIKIKINTILTYNEKCLIYREYVIEPFQAMLEDYYENVDSQFYITKTTIIMSLSKHLAMAEYINIIEMFKDLINTIDDVSITYEKTILNINEINTSLTT